MAVQRSDPSLEVASRIREIQTQAASHMYDDQELADREEAAGAYALENEAHYVAYLNDCVSTSARARDEIRRKQAQCWDVYHEKEPDSYKNKEAWQSRIVVAKPNEAVGYGVAAIKKSFSPRYLSVSDPLNKIGADFWQAVLDIQLDKSHAKFPTRFSSATEMALAIGESMEMIPKWVPGKGLIFDLIEPWKIHRDPDAPPRDPQGGLYWVHSEWLDYHVLLEGEEKGSYFNVKRSVDLGSGGQAKDDPFLDKEEIAKRKEQIWERSTFRKMVLTQELWGTVLSPKGEVLLDRGWYTVAGGRVIGMPKQVPYSRLRWPGISFSPMPHLLRHGGRGFIEGIVSIWESMCTLLCLHEDALKWIVNPPTEINVDALVDPSDVNSWPGKEYLTQDTVHGQQAVRTVQRRDPTGSVLANMQYYDQLFQRGSWVTDAVQGLPGYRQDMTWRESKQNLDQSLGVFGHMGENLEDGAVAAIEAGRDVIACFATYDDYVNMLGGEKVQEAGLEYSGDGELKLPPMSGAFHVAGIGTLMAEAEKLNKIMATIVPLSERPRYAAYIDPYKVLRAIVALTKLEDEEVVVTQARAEEIDKEMAAKAKEEEEAQSREAQKADVGQLIGLLRELKGLDEGENA
ncbi:hypothetical protein [Desulfatibacillum aliphaticivorans]|uniref:hypothetical protein n=1 Tax=Desulfatibacillum aliphaticivorans TaxID=218208 RepID=UPI00040A4A11|nr:hypothetical protein [Desulfatibacillum aliphaticivorans]